MHSHTRYALLFRLTFCARYHDRREAFFDRWDKIAKAVAVIGGAATVATLLGDDEKVRVAIAAAITITSTASLVFSLSQRARAHHDLKRRYQSVDAQVLAVSEPDQAQLDKWFAEVALIEADEPPTLPTLVRICQNETANALGHTDYVQPVGCWRMLFAHWNSGPVPPAKVPHETASA